MILVPSEQTAIRAFEGRKINIKVVRKE
jgi:hypothetical protein